MVYQPDIDAVEPSLELTIDFGASTLTCTGRLDSATHRNVIDAVEELLHRRPANVTVDVARLEVHDLEGAGALVRLQRLVHDAGSILDWRGLSTDHVREVIGHVREVPERVPA